MEFNRNSYQNRHPERPTEKNNIEIDLKEIECEDVAWILVQDVTRGILMNVVMNLLCSTKGGEFFWPGERNGLHGAVQMRCCSIKILVYGDLSCL